MKAFDFTKYIESHTLRLEASRRGGGIEIDAGDYLGEDYPLQMTAYQNYLGGGMLGSVQSSIQGHLRDYPADVQAKALELSEELKKYFHAITNEEAGDYDDNAAGDFDAVQSRPGSAY